MSKDSYEAYVVEIGHQQGKRYARRSSLHITVDHALGRIERLSDLQLREAIQDLTVEHERRITEAQHRQEVAAKCGGYDPFASQSRASTDEAVVESFEPQPVRPTDPRARKELAAKCGGYDPFASQIRRQP